MKVFISDNSKLLGEWDFEKNTLNPNSITVGSKKKVWWKCHNGHSWSVDPGTRISKGSGCPYCAGIKAISGVNDLATCRQDLLDEWSEKNLKKPTEVKEKSNLKVLWVCRDCKCEYTMAIADRTRGHGCPNCAKKRGGEKTRVYNLQVKGSVQTLKPELCEEWDYEKNTSRPDEFTTGSKTRVWWKCKRCGFSWKAQITSRNRGSGCPKCAKNMQTSYPEQALFYYIKQRYENDAVNGYKDLFDNGMELDIYIPSIQVGVEYDGRNWHTEETIEKEKKKYELCRQKGIFLIRIKETQKEGNIAEGTNTSDCNIYIVPDAKHQFIYDMIEKIQKWIPLPNVSVDLDRDDLSIRAQYFSTLRENSIVTRHPEIAAEWDYEKNNGLNPEFFYDGSNVAVWWKCNSGHEWRARIEARTRLRSGCPYCAGIKAIVGVNDLVSLYPDIAAEWDYERNRGISINEITKSSSHKYYWICKKGHHWRAAVSSRTRGEGCPICSSKKVLAGYNDLATTRPDLSAEWDYDKNEISPQEITAGSKKNVFWKCSKGHSWAAVVCSRARGNGCPVCANKKIIVGENDLKTKFPEIAAEWDYEANGDVRPEQIAPHAKINVFWRCPKGHQFKQTVNDRTGSGRGCPVCNDTKKRVLQVDKETKRVQNEYSSISEAAKCFGVSVSTMSNYCNGKGRRDSRFDWIVAEQNNQENE